MNQKKLITTIVIVGVVAVVIGLVVGLDPNRRTLSTQSDGGYGYGTDDYAEESIARMAPAALVADLDMASSYYEPPTAGETAADTDQRVIRTGNLGLVVDRVSTGLTDFARIAEQHQGFVQSSNAYEQPDGSRSGWITVRVPSEQFELTMSAMKDYAVLVRNESVDAQDVTERYTDLEARLRNMQAEEEAYLALLARAGSVSDLLEVQRELSRVRGNIESLQGQLQYLENQTDLSTITAHLEEETTITISSKRFRVAPIFKDAVQSVIQFARWVVTAIIWIVVIGIGIGIPLALLAWIIRRIVRKTHKKKK